MAVQLTVIVKGEDGKVIEGASVSVSPGAVTGETNNKGEVTLTIDGADRYNVTVAHEEVTQTVPYYSLKGKDAARLEVNLAYLAKQEQETQQNTIAVPSKNSAVTPDFVLPLAGGVLLGVLILLLIILLSRARRAKKLSQAKEQEAVMREDIITQDDKDTLVVEEDTAKAKKTRKSSKKSK